VAVVVAAKVAMMMVWDRMVEADMDEGGSERGLGDGTNG
jgi:hypothetical protein